MDEQIYILIAKQLAGEATAQEVQQIDLWISQSEGNKLEYQKIKNIWASSADIFSQPVFNTDSAWNKISVKTINHADVERKRTIAFPAWTKYAVTAAAAIVIFMVMWNPFAGDGDISVLTAKGNNMDITLPDNSHITLRDGSTLKYPKHFASDVRQVTLEGEAFFEVARNEKQPFVIQAGTAEVKVLGTSFNVQCTDAAATVVVATGKVQLKANNKSVYLTPGEKGEYLNNEVTETAVTDSNYLYWKTGRLVYNNQSLSYIISDLSKIYKVPVNFAPNVPEAVKMQMVNISFSTQTLEDILTEICIVAKCHWDKRQPGYILYAD